MSRLLSWKYCLLSLPNQETRLSLIYTQAFPPKLTWDSLCVVNCDILTDSKLCHFFSRYCVLATSQPWRSSTTLLRPHLFRRSKKLWMFHLIWRSSWMFVIIDLWWRSTKRAISPESCKIWPMSRLHKAGSTLPMKKLSQACSFLPVRKLVCYISPMMKIYEGFDISTMMKLNEACSSLAMIRVCKVCMISHMMNSYQAFKI